MNPFIEKAYKHNLYDSHKQHTGIIDSFVEIAQANGHNVICKKEDDVLEEDAKEANLVVSLGGDHTFLVAS